MPVSRAQSRAAETPAQDPTPFADRLAALVAERRSQVCIGFDPAFDAEPWRSASAVSGAGDPDPRAAAAAAVESACVALIESAGPACVAVKPQLARFEMLGAPGVAALERVTAAAQAADLLVIADGKRGDVPVSAAAYADGLFGAVHTPFGEVAGLGVDAATINPLTGADSIEPFVARAEAAGAGLFSLVRTSNPGAADVFDLETTEGLVHERVAALVDGFAGRLTGEHGLSGMGAVVGATEPRFIARLRELMPRSVFLLPGVGAQGGDPAALGPAFGAGPASALVTASRSVAGSDDPAAAAESLRETVWSASGAR
ncbi:MAG TPA: orotidine-5'-phosphate decarboxylase [Solirubrobacterales bacterium]|nr:orotidine-5'-phosphate decarboxylase [Solirubrobacterales bacterium]